MFTKLGWKQNVSAKKEEKVGDNTNHEGHPPGEIGADNASALVVVEMGNSLTNSQEVEVVALTDYL